MSITTHHVKAAPDLGFSKHRLPVKPLSKGEYPPPYRVNEMRTGTSITDASSITYPTHNREANMDWINIAEKKPESKGAYLVKSVDSNDEVSIQTGNWRARAGNLLKKDKDTITYTREWVFLDDSSYTLSDVTHWMELPKP